MDTIERKVHWENIFLTKDTRKVSWFQQIPETSLDIIDSLNMPKTSKIIDAGCGDSYLPDFLLKKGYSDITLVDISEKALETSKNRLIDNNREIRFLVADITSFIPPGKYDIWHDRAVFHFLTDPNDVEKYVNTVNTFISPGGFLILGTFSDRGPDICSGLHVQQYSEENLEKKFVKLFKKVCCFYHDHQTPSGSIQNFIFCIFKKLR